MDAFEQLVGMLLEREGFWVRSNFKVNLTHEDKLAIDRPTTPPWELDLVAYRGATNELWVVECKSYLDSTGVIAAAFDGSNEKAANYYKLFNDENLREIVFRRLRSQLAETGGCLPNPTVTLCLAAGKVKSKSDQEKLLAHFERQHWIFLGEEWVRNGLAKAAESKYHNDVSTIVAKLLLKK